MGYIFFDVECSNHFNGEGKICELGYVITNKSFQILNSIDTLINPGCGRNFRFALIGRKREKDLHLAHEANNYEAYFNAREYRDYYDNFRFLFTQKNALYFGFSCINDKFDISYSNGRVKKDDFAFDAIDVQKLLSLYSDGTYSTKKSLDKTFELMFPNYEQFRLTAHNPKDDSMMTMLILRKICKDLEMSVDELVTSFPDCIIHHSDLSKIKLEAREKKVSKYLIKKCHVLLNKLYDKQKDMHDNPNYIGKFIGVSGTVKNDITSIPKVVEVIKKNGLVYYKGVKGTDLFLAKDEEDVERLLKVFKEPYTGKFLLLDDLLNQQSTIHPRLQPITPGRLLGCHFVSSLSE